MALELRGVVPIVYTPFDDAGDIDGAVVRRLVDYLIDSGAHGLAGVGGASECHKLTIEERKWLAEVVIDQTRGRVPVIIGTSAANTRTAVELSRHAQELGASAVFLTPPALGALSPRSIRVHYQAVDHAISVPILLQHAEIPISVDVMLELANECTSVRYVKEEAGGVTGHTVSDIIGRGAGRLQVFSGGQDALDEFDRGAIGAICGSICVADLARAFNLHAQGDYRAARVVFDHCLPLLYARRHAPLVWAKEVLRRLGIFKNACLREPTGPLMDGQDHRELTAIMEFMGPPY